jgi:hypothetical protein
MKKIKKVKLTPIVNFNQETGQFEILLNEVGIFSSGKTKQEALNKLVDEAKDSAVEYFYNFEMYSGTPKLMEKYPYYLSIGKCKTKNEIISLLDI